MIQKHSDSESNTTVWTVERTGQLLGKSFPVWRRKLFFYKYLSAVDFHPRPHRARPGMRIRVNIDPSVDPIAFPWMAPDDNGVRWPEESGPCPPTPRSECGGDRDGGSKPDRSPYYEAGPRTSEDNQGVIVRDVEDGRVQGQDFYIAALVNDVYIAVGNQVTKVPRLKPHPLNGVHHIGALSKNCVAELLSPSGVATHHVEY